MKYNKSLDKKSLSKKLVRYSIVSLMCLSSNSYAADKNVSLKKFLNPDFFSLSKKKEDSFDTPSATYVLSSEDIRRSGSTSIPEALRMIPGVQVSRMNSHTYAISIRGFNRQFSNKLLVMVDGRTVYTPLFSGVSWDIHDYLLEDIDRIEVVRGPGGTIWGANAVNGVINIITKSSTQTQGAYFSQIVGNQDRSITELRYGGKTDSGDSYRVYAKRAARDGVDQAVSRLENRDGNIHERGGFRYDSSKSGKNTFSVSGDIFDSKAQNYFSNLDNIGKNDKDAKGANIIVNWDRKISKKSNFTLQTYFDYDQFDIPVLKRSARTFDVDFQHFYNFSRNNQFIWGLGYRQVDDKIKEGTTANGSIPIDYEPNTRNDELFTVFIQDKIGLVPDKLYLTIGSKFEHNDFTGFEYQPNARLAYYPSRNQTLWASVSRAVRTPTRGEDDIDLKNTNSALTLNRGSDTYESEVLQAYEIGYRIKPSHKTLIDMTAFYNDYSNLRTFEATGINPPVAANHGKGDSYGFEVSSKWQVNNDWRLEASYEHLKLNLDISPDSTDDESLLRNVDRLDIAEGQSPRNQIKFRSFYNVTPKVEFDNVIYYVDNLPEGFDRRTKGIPSYVRFDTRLGYLATNNLDLSVGIQNLFDQRHTEFKAATYQRQTEVGRTIFFKLVWQY